MTVISYAQQSVNGLGLVAGIYDKHAIQVTDDDHSGSLLLLTLYS